MVAIVAMGHLVDLFHSLRMFRKQHFKSATTGVATKNMRNELNRLVNTVTEPATRKVSFGFYPLEKSETRRIWMTGFRYGDAIVLLSLHSVSCREGSESGVVRTTDIMHTA